MEPGEAPGSTALVARLAGHTSSACCLSMSSDGAVLASGGEVGRARLPRHPDHTAWRQAAGPPCGRAVPGASSAPSARCTAGRPRLHPRPVLPPAGAHGGPRQWRGHHGARLGPQQAAHPVRTLTPRPALPDPQRTCRSPSARLPAPCSAGPPATDPCCCSYAANEGVLLTLDLRQLSSPAASLALSQEELGCLAVNRAGKFLAAGEGWHLQGCPGWGCWQPAGLIASCGRQARCARSFCIGGLLGQQQGERLCQRCWCLADAGAWLMLVRG